MPPTWIDRGDNYPDPGGISLGAVVGNQKVASKALAVPVAEAQQHVAEAPAKHADETSWRDCTGRVWLWTAVTPFVTVFQIHATRSAAAAKALLGQAKGVLISDRYSGYHWWPLWARQVCGCPARFVGSRQAGAQARTRGQEREERSRARGC